MLGQHEVLAACQALCNSQGVQQPKQPGTITSSTGAVLSPRLNPQTRFLLALSYFKPGFQSYRTARSSILGLKLWAVVHSHPPHHNG